MDKHTVYTQYLIPAGQLLEAVRELYRAQLGKNARSQTKIYVGTYNKVTTPRKLLHSVMHYGFEALHTLHAQCQTNGLEDYSLFAEEADKLAKMWALTIYEFCRRIAAPNCYPVCVDVLGDPKFLKLNEFDLTGLVRVLAVMDSLSKKQIEATKHVKEMFPPSILDNPGFTLRMNHWKTLIRNSSWDAAMRYFGNMRAPKIRWLGSENGDLQYAVVLAEYTAG